MQGYVLPAPLFLHMDFLGHVYYLGTYTLLDTTHSMYPGFITMVFSAHSYRMTVLIKCQGH